MRNTLILLTILATSQACVSARDQQTIHQITTVDVTSNPDAVKSCKRLGNVTLTGYTGHTQMSGLSTGVEITREEYLRLQVHQYGGNMLFRTRDEGGEAYLCPASP